jgi:hypothetical protein
MESDIGCFLHEMLRSAEAPGVQSTSHETRRGAMEIMPQVDPRLILDPPRHFMPMFK